MKKSLFCLVVVLLLVGCKTETENNKEKVPISKVPISITLNPNLPDSFSASPKVMENTYSGEEVVLPNGNNIWETNGKYEFCGWAVSKPGMIEYKAGDKFSSKSSVYLYASWEYKAKYYTVSYDANGGSGSRITHIFEEGESVSIIEGGAFLNGNYIFACWNTERDGSGVDYESGTRYSDNADLTLYAKWITVSSDLTLKKSKFSDSSSGKEYYSSMVYSCNTAATTVEIPEYYQGYKVTVIRENAFKNRTMLRSITMPDSVTSIGEYAFRGCNNLTSIQIPSSVTNIGEAAFMDCTGLLSVKIPASVTEIGNYAFSGCSELASISILNSATSIGNGAFRDCKKLIDVSLSESVTSIGDEVFLNCTGLTTITIPNSVTSIGAKVFSGCTRITSINYTGTRAQWYSIERAYNWNYNINSSCVIHCTDGDISANPNLF